MSSLFSKFPQPIIQPVQLDELGLSDVSVDIKRDDLIDDVVSGNKLFKLHYHLQAFKEQKRYTLLTFGGAYSNHLHATAYAGKMLGIQTVGIVRAEPHELEHLTPTLNDCKYWGMVLEPVSRSEYRLKQDSYHIQQIAKQYSDVYWVPEGGSGELGVKGAQLILEGVDQSQYDVIVLACGTGTTLAGVIKASAPHVTIIGVPVLKGAKWMTSEVAQYLDAGINNWQLELNYHFSGYGKWNETLLAFIEQMQTNIDLPLDPVYTGQGVLWFA